jgi:hypothetical protein
MAIGFLSVLTLFPLAARKIVRSIDNDRVNLMAANASGCEQILGIRRSIQSQMNLELNAGGSPLLPSSVYHFDPIGSYGGSTSSSNLIWGNQFRILDATALTPSLSINSVKEWMTSQDEINFEPWGLPESNFRKGNRYSVSFLYRRNTLADKNSLDTVMLVYAGRSIEFGNTTETKLNVTGLDPTDPTNSTLLVDDPIQGPGGPDRFFGRNAWLMDLSIESAGGAARPRWKKFYQVQSVDGTSGATLKVTLDRPWESPVIPTSTANLIWVDYLFDWFDRGIGP